MGRVTASLLAVGKCGLGIGTIWRGARGTHTGTRQSDRGTQGRARMPEGIPLLQIGVFPPGQSAKGRGLGVSRMSGAGLPKLPILPSLRESARLSVPGPQLHRRRIRKVSRIQQSHRPRPHAVAKPLKRRGLQRFHLRISGLVQNRVTVVAGRNHATASVNYCRTSGYGYYGSDREPHECYPDPCDVELSRISQFGWHRQGLCP
jgi:hypothetical protein